MKMSGAFGAAILAVLMSISTAMAVEFKWANGDGTVQSLADYKGKPVILHFWASWCPPCRAEMPELLKWSRQHTDVKLVVITLDRNIADAEAFLNEAGMPFPPLQGKMSESQKLGVRGLPTTVVIGAGGDIVKTRVGAVNWSRSDDGGAILAAVQAGG